MKYFTSTTVYDNGQITITPPMACEDSCNSKETELFNRTIYFDVFEDKTLAEEFYMESCKALAKAN